MASSLKLSGLFLERLKQTVFEIITWVTACKLTT
uniref:Uncharacterized protein n=1 Tax=Anguilla anguilla TaxID=7936 RepID=A0A0E9U678_ANGAN